MTDNKSSDTLTQRILVVDDDARLRSLLQRFLEDDGFRDLYKFILVQSNEQANFRKAFEENGVKN